MNLYSDEILEHYKNSAQRGSLKDYNYRSISKNVSCGDELTIYIKLDGQKIVDAKFEGRGCAISQATCSMVLESLIGREIDALGDFQEDDILSFVGINLGLNRRKCALLVLDGLEKIYAQLATVRPQQIDSNSVVNKSL